MQQLAEALGTAEPGQDDQDKQHRLWALQVAEDLEAHYLPLPVRGRPGLLSGPKATEEALKASRAGKAGDLEADIAKAYGAWQLEVSLVEQTNEGKLQAVLWAQRTLHRLGKALWLDPVRSGEAATGGEAKLLRAALEACVRFVVAQYGLRDLPATAREARELVAKTCRNYRAMPREWRGL